jgi:hypothetical protein
MSTEQQQQHDDPLTHKIRVNIVAKSNPEASTESTRGSAEGFGREDVERKEGEENEPQRRQPFKEDSTAQPSTESSGSQQQQPGPMRDRDERLEESSKASRDQPLSSSNIQPTTGTISKEDEQQQQQQKQQQQSDRPQGLTKDQWFEAKEKDMEKLWHEHMLHHKENHDLLLKFVGDWIADFAFSGPAPGNIARGIGETSIRPLFDGKFVEMCHKHKMNDFDFEGRCLMSYSPHQDEFHAVWLDNISSSLHPSHGKRQVFDRIKDGFELLSFSPFPDILSGKLKTTRQTYRIDDNDCLTFCSYDRLEGDDDGEKMTMQIVFRRAGSPAEEIARKEREKGE